MSSEPPPRPASRSHDGEGITVGYDVHRRPHAAACAHGRPDAPSGPTDGLADEIPDVPTRLPGHVPGGPRLETHVMLCGCGRTGKAPFCDHSGPCAEHSRSGPGAAGRTLRGAPDG